MKRELSRCRSSETSRTSGNLDQHDTNYFDFSKSSRVEIEFDRGIEAPVKSISLRLPREMLNQLKVLANKKDIPYQSLIKVYLGGKDRGRAESELDPAYNATMTEHSTSSRARRILWPLRLRARQRAEHVAAKNCQKAR